LKIYLASSWKNKEYVDRTATTLRKYGHEVDNFSEKESQIEEDDHTLNRKFTKE